MTQVNSNQMYPLKDSLSRMFKYKRDAVHILHQIMSPSSIFPQKMVATKRQRMENVNESQVRKT